MFISIRNKNLRRQQFKTSCWISAAHFVLHYLGDGVPLNDLHARYYRPDSSSYSAMSGAGHPRKILGDYAIDEGRFPWTIKTQKTPKKEVVAAIESNIADNIPVIAAVRSHQIKGFGHALLITAIETGSGTVGYKDPGTGASPRRFGVDVRSVRYNEFVNGFPYRFHRTMKQMIWVYCCEITYLRPMNEMSLFDL